MALIICSFCGKTTSDWNDACPFCGARLTGEETKVIDSVAEEIQEGIVDEKKSEGDGMAEEVVENMIGQEEDNTPKFCRYCGRELVKGAAFCPFCGKTVHAHLSDTPKTMAVNNQPTQPQTNPINRQPVTKQTPAISQRPEPLVVSTPPPLSQSNGGPIYQQPPRTVVVQQIVPTPVYQTVEEKPKKKTGCGTWILFFLLLGIIFFILIPAYNDYSKRKKAEELSTNRADYRTNVSYEDLARKPEQYKGTLICFKGKVIQVMDSSSTVTIRLATKEEQYLGYYDDVLYCTISKAFLNEERLLEDDIITIYGKADGIKEYTAILGNKVQIPSVIVRIVDVEKK